MSLDCVLPHTDKLLAPPAADSDGESDGSDRVPVPSFQNSFSQAFEKALLQLDSGATPSPQPVVETGRITLHCCNWAYTRVLPTCTNSLCDLFQMRKEGRRKRRNRNFCSVLQWFTQSRHHWSLCHLAQCLSWSFHCVCFTPTQTFCRTKKGNKVLVYCQSSCYRSTIVLSCFWVKLKWMLCSQDSLTQGFRDDI